MTDEGVIRCFAAAHGDMSAIPLDEAVDRFARSRGPLEGPLAGELVWIDVTKPGEFEEKVLRDRLALHPLAVEDSLRGRQRPKLDRYQEYFFLVFYAARINPGRERMALNEIHIFLGNNFLVTVHDKDVPEVLEIVEAWRDNPARVGESGAAAHALLDAIVDDYFPVIEHFSERLELLEDRIFGASMDGSLHHAIRFRHEMIMMRRILSPERDLLSSLLRHDLPIVRPELVPYFQDVYDHVIRVTEEIDSFRDLLTGLIDVHSSNAANRLNQTMQTLTSWSIILMSMTLVAGVYGMNFVVMPELNLPWGYYAALGVMSLVGLLLITYFRRRGWL